jgi:DNA repair protein RecO (recombination protein O)
MRVKLQPAYVVHSRPYRDSSALLDVFTAEYGRISLVARGVRRTSRKGTRAALLQPFIPLLLSYSGRSELKTLGETESVQGPLVLGGARLFSGMYMNELVVRLLHQNDAHPLLFAAYDESLKALAGLSEVDTVLRKFELILLNELGYGLAADVDGISGQPIQQDLRYRYESECGLVVVSDDAPGHDGIYKGSDLMRIASGEYGGPVRNAAKCLLREALAVHLGSAPLRSRELFQRIGAVPKPG